MITGLIQQLCLAGLIEPEQEVEFHPSRKWRFDFAYPELKIAIEQEGGVWTGGRHVRGKGFEEDARKYNEAQILGWMVLRFSTRQIANGDALEIIERAIAAREEAEHPGK